MGQPIPFVSLACSTSFTETLRDNTKAKEFNQCGESWQKDKMISSYIELARQFVSPLTSIQQFAAIQLHQAFDCAAAEDGHHADDGARQPGLTFELVTRLNTQGYTYRLWTTTFCVLTSS